MPAAESASASPSGCRPKGATVVLTARKPEALAEAVAQFPEGTALAVAGKSDDPEHRAEVYDTIAEKFGRLDVLVTNVGINPVYGPLIDLDLDAARKILDVNVLGTLAWVQEAVHHEKLNFRENKGRVVSISSVAGERPSPGISFYGISKAAVSHLTKSLAVELGPDIRVNAVAPAVVKTDFATALYEGREEEVAPLLTRSSASELPKTSPLPWPTSRPPTRIGSPRRCSPPMGESSPPAEMPDSPRSLRRIGLSG